MQRLQGLLPNTEGNTAMHPVEVLLPGPHGSPRGHPSRRRHLSGSFQQLQDALVLLRWRGNPQAAFLCPARVPALPCAHPRSLARYSVHSQTWGREGDSLGTARSTTRLGDMGGFPRDSPQHTKPSACPSVITAMWVLRIILTVNEVKSF